MGRFFWFPLLLKRAHTAQVEEHAPGNQWPKISSPVTINVPVGPKKEIATITCHDLAVEFRKVTCRISWEGSPFSVFL